jgi:hypothetical protein
MQRAAIGFSTFDGRMSLRYNAIDVVFMPDYCMQLKEKPFHICGQPIALLVLVADGENA